MKTKTPKRSTSKPRKPKPDAAINSAPSVNGTPLDPADVMTLAETAAFLRVDERDVRQMADEGKLPARRVSGQWRFLKSALLEWFRQPEPKPDPDDWRESNRRMLEMAGAWKDDPTIPKLIEDIYQQRKQNTLEDAQR